MLQIAAHEQHFGLERLYATCRIARELVDDYRIARVIARPFAGDAVDGFRRTGNRHDYSVPPTAPTLLDALVAAGHQVLAIGKVSDIFAGQGISRAIPASGLPALLRLAQAGDLVLLTADHGNDPTWPGSDHTRECVPLLAVGGGLRTGAAGLRDGFADLGQTLARHFGLPPLRHGVALPLSS